MTVRCLQRCGSVRGYGNLGEDLVSDCALPHMPEASSSTSDDDLPNPALHDTHAAADARRLLSDRAETLLGMARATESTNRLFTNCGVAPGVGVQSSAESHTLRFLLALRKTGTGGGDAGRRIHLVRAHCG
jgi:hypothetical protein